MRKVDYIRRLNHKLVAFLIFFYVLLFLSLWVFQEPVLANSKMKNLSKEQRSVVHVVLSMSPGDIYDPGSPVLNREVMGGFF